MVNSKYYLDVINYLTWSAYNGSEKIKRVKKKNFSINWVTINITSFKYLRSVLVAAVIVAAVVLMSKAAAVSTKIRWKR